MHKKYGIEENTRLLLVVGRLGKEKNIGFIIDVFARIYSRHPDTKLVIVGGGPEETALRSQAGELGVSDGVIFTGMVDKDEVAKYYCSSYLFVFSSVTETQGLVLGEAKAAGIPSVAVRALGVSEMISDGEDGYLVENSKEQFENKLELLLNDEHLRNKMAKAAIFNSERLSSMNSARELVSCYEEILNGVIEAKGRCKYS